MKIRNPNAEGRKKPEGRNPNCKSQHASIAGQAGIAAELNFGNSAFGLLSPFGLLV
jgi:hypothetical protein